MGKRRFEDLDFVKAASILLVVFCHLVVIPAQSIAGNVMMLLAWGAVPCFMMCSGYVLLHRDEPCRTSVMRTVRAYLVMVAWKTVYLLFYAVFGTVKAAPAELFQYLFLFESLDGVGLEHFWFLYAYLAVLILLPLLRPLFQERKQGAILLVLVMSYLSNQFVNTANLLVQLGSGFLGFEAIDLSQLQRVFPYGGEYSSMLPCFLLGGMIRLRDEEGKQSHVWMSLLLLLAGLCGLMLVKYLQTHSFAWENKYLSAGYGWTSTLAMAVGLFGILRRVGRRRWARWLGTQVGQSTMGIFYLHYLLLHLLSLYAYPHLPNALWVNVLKTIAVTAASAGLTSICRKMPLVRKLF